MEAQGLPEDRTRDPRHAHVSFFWGKAGEARCACRSCLPLCEGLLGQVLALCPLEAWSAGPGLYEVPEDRGPYPQEGSLWIHPPSHTPAPRFGEYGYKNYPHKGPQTYRLSLCLTPHPQGHPVGSALYSVP